jgi:hypothetical protein
MATDCIAQNTFGFEPKWKPVVRCALALPAHRRREAAERAQQQRRLELRRKVPHCDAKGKTNQLCWTPECRPRSSRPRFNWDNFIDLAMGPKPGADGELFSLA